MKLSIITINYNNCEGLRKTIKSVANQTWHDFEYIVIDGGSTDGSVDVIKESADKIDYWVSEPDLGIYNAMNKGVSVANGEFCQFLNSGDCLNNIDTLNQIIVKLQECDIYFAKLRFNDTQSIYEAPEIITMRTLYKRSLPHPSSFIRRKLLLKYPYDETLRIVADWKFWIQSIILGNVTYRLLPNIIVDFEAMGVSAVNTTLVSKEREVVLRNLFPERILKDYFHFQNGIGYQETTYDKLFIEIGKRRYRRIVYVVTICFMRLFAIFKKSARFIYNFPWDNNL